MDICYRPFARKAQAHCASACSKYKILHRDLLVLPSLLSAPVYILSSWCSELNMSQKSLSFIPSSKGKELAVVDQYIFELQKRSGETRYFRCTHYKRKCAARLVVYADGNFLEKNSHFNHMPDRE